MRRATGPGKTKDDLLDPPGTKKGISGLLFNFDFDDSSVKPEHQDWLKRIAVPQLTASPNSTVALKGMASRKGSDAYNDALSGRRVDAVKTFLIQQGVKSSQITMAQLGETAAALAGRADGTDEEIDRAVSVDILPPARTLGKPLFDSLRIGFVPRGFGRNSNPQFLMVPALFRSRPVRLRHAEGMLVKTTIPSVVRMKSDQATEGLTVNSFIAPSDNFIIDMVGGMPGEAKIEVFELNGELRRVLEIDCLPRREVSVAFHFVSDKNQKAERPRSDVDIMMAGCNLAFNNSANVFFTTASVAPLAFPTQDLGDPMSVTTVGNKFSTLTQKGDGKSRINVFFVWEFQRADNSGDTDARADDIPGANVVFEDDAGIDFDKCMAHEFGHCLGLEHIDEDAHPTFTNRLMWPFTDQRGDDLTREEARTANKFGPSVRG